MRAKIIGTGSYLPKKILTNSDFEKIVDTSDEWITTRTGMKERHISAEDETTSDLAYKASKVAIKKAGLEPGDIDAIIVATATPDMNFPSTACLLQEKLQAKEGMAMDISAACTGFIYALQTGRNLILSGDAKYVLVVAAEQLSKIVDYTDRNTCVLFGDGAGAAILGAAKSKGILGCFLGADGAQSSLLKKEGGQSFLPFHKMGPYDFQRQFMYMNGKVVFKHAIKRMTSSLSKALEKAGKTLEDLNMIIPHQANLRIIEMVRKYARATEDQVYINLHRTGNISAATIPVALDEALNENAIKTGDIVGLTAFGGGLTYGACVIQI